MGNREQLLEGAKRCLYERGYARTTARDVVAASGANLASIGYHFGSKEALLDAALIEAIGAMTTRRMGLSNSGNGPDELPHAWDQVIEEFESYRPLLVAHVEAWAQTERSPALRARFSDFYRSMRQRGVEQERTLHPGLDEATAQTVVAVTSMLTDGLIVQWLIEPEQIPSGQDVATGLRALADALDPE